MSYRYIIFSSKNDDYNLNQRSEIENEKNKLNQVLIYF